MMRTIYNAGDQSVRFVPMHPRTGRPVVVDSATYSIFDARWHDTSENHTIVDSAAAERDSTHAILTAGAGYSQANTRLIPATDPRMQAGRPYLLSESYGPQREVVTLASAGLTSSLAESPIRANYSAGSRVQGIELVGTFPQAEANEEDNVEDKGGPYVVIWSYEIDGDPYHVATSLWLDRYSLAPPITSAFVLQAAPDLAQRARDHVAQSIVVAWDSFCSEAEKAGHDPSMLPPSLTARMAIRDMALSLLYRWTAGGPDDIEYSEALAVKARDGFGHVLIGQAPQSQVELTREDQGAKAQPHGHTFKLS